MAQALVLLAVQFLETGTGGLVAAFDGFKGVVGQTGGDEFGCGAEQAVSAADIVVEKGERFAGFEGFNQRVTLHSSTAMELMSTPLRQWPMTSRRAVL